jgi:hypothetical protein
MDRLGDDRVCQAQVGANAELIDMYLKDDSDMVDRLVAQLLLHEFKSYIKSYY